MAPVAVVTDTTHYMPREIVERHGLHEVALYVNWNGRTDRETDLGDFDAYYDHLRSASDMPTTSQPSVGDFLSVYEPLLAAGHDVVSIHI
jgi:DegV family protein with EDD domain